VGLRAGSASAVKAQNAGLTVKDIDAAVEGADVVMILAPDEHQALLYRKHVAPNIKQGAALAFAHGFNIHFEQIEPRADLDVIMIAPKGPGHLAEAAPASSKPPFVKRPKPTSSVSRRSFAAAPPRWSRPGSRCWWRPVMRRRWPTSNVCTS